MIEPIPHDVIDFTREIFAEANFEATMALARQPAAHEEQLDFQIFAALDRIGPRLVPRSKTAIQIDTHWLGGRRHFGRWEIADIGIVIVVRRGGRLLWRKVALLQSKRLYSREVPVAELDRSDYQIGIGRLVDSPEHVPPLTAHRSFHFTDDCVYGAMASGSEQVKRIDEYERRRNMPVYYSFYHPPRVPYQGAIPRTATLPLEREEPKLGCRIMTAKEVHEILETLPVGRTPQFSEMKRGVFPTDDDNYQPHGWRLENFVADEMMTCREGRVFERQDDEDLYALLYERTAPIASLVQVSVDLPPQG